MNKAVNKENSNSDDRFVCAKDRESKRTQKVIANDKLNGSSKDSSSDKSHQKGLKKRVSKKKVKTHRDRHVNTLAETLKTVTQKPLSVSSTARSNSLENKKSVKRRISTKVDKQSIRKNKKSLRDDSRSSDSFCETAKSILSQTEDALNNIRRMVTPCLTAKYAESDDIITERHYSLNKPICTDNLDEEITVLMSDNQGNDIKINISFMLKAFKNQGGNQFNTEGIYVGRKLTWDNCEE
uniref:Protein kinase domain-containing protein n=1 Tax=Rhabditophanes sp. KR3021 TaxID=114890 RepID=A0AC35UFQ6_9BILA